MSSSKFPTTAQRNFLKEIVEPAGKGDLEQVVQILANEPKWIRVIGSHGRTMLWEAAYRGRLNVVEYLIEQGADINAPGCHYTPHGIEISPFCVAKLKKRPEIANLLIEAGANVGFHTLAYLGDIDGVQKTLAEDESSLNEGHMQSFCTSDSDRTFEYRLCSWATPLAYAIAGMQEAVMDFLLKEGAVLHDEMHAIARLRAKKVSAILQKFDAATGQKTPDPNLEGYGNWPPLVYLCRGDRGGNPDAIVNLINQGIDIEQKNHKGQTALHVAARAGLIAAVSVLLENGADSNSTDNDLRTPLHAAVLTNIKRHERSREVIQKLMENGADPKHRDKRGTDVVSAIKKSKRPDKTKVIAILSGV